ncbi:sorting nexin-21 isoform X3 [Zootermopsis nevadensis]|uniref:sorting nexin-21 isoform X3 n=1 Tax=Zootermopsis nevadensis TaxID=136037 RepID=UPI000B8E5078|nr:sorting nexin-21 isoform X3 [Zootermopsis nevadensis]
MNEIHALNKEEQNLLQTMASNNEEKKSVHEELEKLALDDEPDTRLGQGTLSFNEAHGVHSQAGAHIRSWAKVPRVTIGEDSAGTTDVTNGEILTRPALKFEVVSARTVDQNNEKKHVAYTVMVRKDGIQPDPNPAVIERRYSDFLELYESLRHEFPSLMTHLTFPKKVLLGNFAPGVISERSAGFEALLEHIITEEKLRESSCLTSFLQGREQREARQWMVAQRYDQAIPLLENSFRLLNKLYTDRHPVVMLTLCRLVASCNADPTTTSAERFADLALRRYEAVSDADLLQFYVPLLQLCVRLWWSLGRDKRLLEARLEDLKRRGIKVDGCPTLLDALMAMDQT